MTGSVIALKRQNPNTGLDVLIFLTTLWPPRKIRISHFADRFFRKNKTYEKSKILNSDCNAFVFYRSLTQQLNFFDRVIG